MVSPLGFRVRVVDQRRQLQPIVSCQPPQTAMPEGEGLRGVAIGPVQQRHVVIRVAQTPLPGREIQVEGGGLIGREINAQRQEVGGLQGDRASRIGAVRRAPGSHAMASDQAALPLAQLSSQHSSVSGRL